MTTEEMVEKLKGMLSPRRFVHSLNVMETAVKLAEKYGAEKEKAIIAALLHDCAKDVEGDRLLELCKKYGVNADEITMLHPELIHAPLSARMAFEDFGVDCQEVLDAISFHTTGRENMGTLEKVIYLADCIEPSRSFPGVDRARELAEQDLDEAVVYCLERSMVYVLEKGKLLHPDTLKARNQLLLERLKKSEDN